jgi:hypothetical protein
MDTKEAKEWFEYSNGELYWKKGRRRNKKAGSPHPTGYIQVKWKDKTWRLHRIVWIWHENKLLKELEIDHINRIRTDNRIENLRQVTKSINNANKKAIFVNYCKGKWKAYTSRVLGNGKQIHLGVFETKKDAEKAAQVYLSSQV